MISLLHRTSHFKAPPSPWTSDAIIREELFSSERLEQHARSLAEAQKVTSKPLARRSLRARLHDNELVLLAAYRAIAAAAGDSSAITPAAEWLIDNYHLVEQQIRQIKDDLPPRFYRQLPKLEGGPFVGYPRVFGIAWAYVAHSDSRFDPETLRRFVRAYQNVQPLTIGELWALAITLRIVLVENLRRAAQRIVGSRAAREAADRVADRLLGVNGFAADPKALIQSLKEDAAPSPAFVVEVVKRLRDQDPRVTPSLNWLENKLKARGTTSDQIVRDEHQRQGASNVTVRNIITSMRLISDVNWADLFEDVSLVDEVLRSASHFASMDFATRNLYRSAIEELARGSLHSELEIANRAMGATAAARDGDPRERDPGYHLLAAGRRAFELAMGYRAPLRHWPSRLSASLGPAGYIGAVLLVTAIVLAVPLWILGARGIAGSRLLLLALLGVVPALDLAVALVNRAVTRGVGARMLPGLALRDGIPAHLRTMVVIPTLLTSRAAIEAQIERLEVHCLASSQGDLHFALLSDWTDAASEQREGDDALLAVAAAGIARLNQQHAPAAAGKRFYLFHRRRVWSEGQQQWMGWERKRGKLHELNRLLRGAADTTFMAIDGQAPVAPAGVRYVVTLDADTRLPRETVRRLVGKLAHPLNEPRFDRATGRIVEGYAVLQPRVTPSLPIGREGSAFQRIFSSMTGIDPYDAAVSDVYQDLFGEGSYAGKGIYDVDAFEAALGDRVPDGSLLSHDLFEGTFARAGLASDVEVVEEFPGRYDVAAARTHRWARGDWQLLPWILGRGDAARRGSDSLPLIARWKMLDNLRRTLSAPSGVLALLAGWLLPLNAALPWTAFVLTTIAMPALLPVFAAIAPRRRGILARSHLRALGSDLWLAAMQIVLVITFLAHQAWLMTDAIGRTLYRLLVSHRNLLEWVTAAQAQLSARLDLAAVYRRMSASVFMAGVVVLVIGLLGAEAWWAAMPFVILWTAAPAIARRISVSPLVAGRVSVPAADARALRLVARRTWRFFETFVTADDHMLPPDNLQEDPQPVLAHRTSPTNLGLYLLCVVTARDFGWAGTEEAVERLEATLATMLRLQRFRGHFYNWYDTRDLRPLDPQYVSSVDSGNLAAHLITVANTCREWIDAPLGDPAANAAFVAGVEDAMQLTRAALKELPDDRRTQIATRHQVAGELDALAGALAGGAAALADIVAQAAILADGARALAGEHGDAAVADTLFWAEATRDSIASWHRDITRTDAARRSLDERLAAVETTARAMAQAMEFDFLLDPERKLLSIGYRTAEGALDPSCYDLLASEARLASFVAIAKNDVMTRHWFHLGRPVTPIGHGAALISWSGSMFEYLMPSLVMR
ncbi:MAG: protein ndvB, partial [Steroidobacteraceae bacterium]